MILRSGTCYQPIISLQMFVKEGSKKGKIKGNSEIWPLSPWRSKTNLSDVPRHMTPSMYGIVMSVKEFIPQF
jgi:hypothetical protein